MFTTRSRQHGRPMPRTQRRHRGRLAVRSTRKPNHVAVMVTTVLCCLLLISFLVYDLVFIYEFFSDQNALWSGNMSSQQQGTTEQSAQDQMIDHTELLEKIESYSRQRSLAAALVVLMILQLLSGIAVYMGFKKKIKKLLLGYLVLTFPVMTFAMIYAILFMVNESSTILYVKIASVILVYTIQANVYRMVYRMYQWLKYQERREARGHQGHTNNGYHGNQEDLPPVHIQLKPPPYEKEPPPYELKPPGVAPSTSFEDSSPSCYSSHMTNASPSDVYSSPSVFPADLHLSPISPAPDVPSSSPNAESPDTDTQPPISVSYDAPPTNTTESVYHIQTDEQDLPPPYTVT